MRILHRRDRLKIDRAIGVLKRLTELGQTPGFTQRRKFLNSNLWDGIAQGGTAAFVAIVRETMSQYQNAFRAELGNILVGNQKEFSKSEAAVSIGLKGFEAFGVLPIF